MAYGKCKFFFLEAAEPTARGYARYGFKRSFTRDVADGDGVELKRRAASRSAALKK